MGMFSEANAEANAKQLEGIILDLIKGDRWRDIRSAARAVAKEKLYNWYLDECGETWGSYKPNPEIVKEFGDIDKTNISDKTEITEKAKHFINAFGKYSMNVIEKARKGGYESYNEELFNEVERLLKIKGE